jgi:hypothetical protein
MKRRELLRKSAAGGTIVLGGCNTVLQEANRRLWFLRIHNGSTQSVDLDVTVLRSGSKVFNQNYNRIPSFQDADQDNPSYEDSEDIVFINNEWEPKPGNYAVEYSYRGDSKRQKVNDIKDINSEHIGAGMLFLGGASGPPQPVFEVVEFESRSDVMEFFEGVNSDTEDS